MSCNLLFPVDHHGKSGRDHPPNDQRPVVGGGEEPGGVDANQPVGLGAAKGSLIDAVEGQTGTKVGKALPDGLVFHAGDPEPQHGLGTLGQIVDVAEDEFSLPARVAGIDDLGHICPIHEAAQ